MTLLHKYVESKKIFEQHIDPETFQQGFLTQFIQTNNQLDVTINGDMSSSPFASLQPALSNLHLSTHINGEDAVAYSYSICINNISTYRSQSPNYHYKN